MKKFFKTLCNNMELMMPIVGSSVAGMFLLNGIQTQDTFEKVLGGLLIADYLVEAALRSNRKG